MEGLRWRDVQQWEQLPSGMVDQPEFLASGWPTAGHLTDPIDPEQQDRDSPLGRREYGFADDGDECRRHGRSGELWFRPAGSIHGRRPPAAAWPGRLVAPGNLRVYQPTLQTNSGNATNGDIVSGYYGPDQSGVEQSDYTRNDYSPVASSAGSTSQPPSMLVRMRRVAPGNSLDSGGGRQLQRRHGSISLRLRGGHRSDQRQSRRNRPRHLDCLGRFQSGK